MPATLADLAKTMRRAKVPVVRKAQAPPQEAKGSTENELPVAALPTKPVPPAPVAKPLDSWDPRYQEYSASTAPVDEEISETGFVEETRTSRRMVKQKARYKTVTIAMSEEEQRILRAHASQLNVSFSTWARNALFRAMGRKPPARPKRGL